MPYLTGVQRQLQLSGTIVANGVADPLMSFPQHLSAPSLAVQALIGTAAAGLGVAALVDVTVGGGIYLRANNGHGIVGTAGNVPQTPPWSADFSGNWTITLDVEQCVDDVAHTSNNAYGMPTYGGPGITDFPGGNRCYLYERTRVGGNAAASITMGGYTASASGTIGTATILPTVYNVSRIMGIGASNMTGTVQCGLSFLDWAEKSYSHSYGSVSCTADRMIANGGISGNSGTMTSSCSPPRRWQLQGALRSDVGAWQGAGTVRVKCLAGSAYTEVTGVDGWTASGLQETYWYQATLDGSVQPTLSASEATPVQAWLVPASPDGTAEWRMLQHGWDYDAFTIAQAQSVDVDGGYTVTGTASITRTLTTQSLNGYRWLQIATGAPTQPFTVTIGTKQWDTTTSAGGTALVDLCSPTNATINADTLTTRWPWPVDVDTVSGSGALWGCERVADYTLSNIASGVGFTVPANGVKLVRRDHTRMWWLPEFDSWRSDGTTVTRRQFMMGCTDGRWSYENEDGYRDALVPFQDSLRSLVAEVGTVEGGYVRHQGWSAALGTAIDVADGTAYSNIQYGYLNRNRPATWAWGGGAVWAPVGGTHQWRYGVDVNADSTLTVPAQMLYDEVEFYPGIGDVFGHLDGTAGSGTAIILRCHRYLRGAASGLVLSSADGRPEEGVVVQLYDATGAASYGNGTSDVYGHYLTGSPWGAGSAQHVVQAQFGAYPAGTIQMASRFRHRVALRGLASGTWVSYDHADHGVHARAYTDSGSVICQFARDTFGADWDVPIQVGAGSVPCVRWAERYGLNVPAVVTFSNGGMVVMTQSNDMGRSWGTAVTIGTGTNSCVVPCSDGRIWVYRIAGTAIIGMCTDSQGGTVVADTVVIPSGVDPTGVDADEYGSAEGTWNMNLTYAAGGVVTTKRATDGVTFS